MISDTKTNYCVRDFQSSICSLSLGFSIVIFDIALSLYP